MIPTDLGIQVWGGGGGGGGGAEGGASLNVVQIIFD